jgi:branched-chain amino acid transport system ATP-binding protein
VPGLLELVGVDMSFGKVVVADGLSLVLASGETVGVVGPNGAGKTSMLNLITGNLIPSRGKILLDGTDVTRLPVHDRARLGIGRTHQVPQPFGGMSVFENVLIGALYAGRSRASDDPVEAAVDALRRTELVNRANVPAGRLPLLDRKRLELARALAIGPRVLLLDEIAGGLTEPEVERLVGTIREVRGEGIGTIWIEHIVSALLSVVDRLVAINVGRILADGEPRAVMASREVQTVYLGAEVIV